MPLILVNDDEALTYQVEDTTFTYRRLSHREREEFLTLFRERGIFNQTGFDNAVLVCGLTGWQNLLAQHGPVLFPTDGSIAERRAAVLHVVERLPMQVAVDLCLKIQEGSPAALAGEWSGLLNGTPSSVTLPRGDAIPVSSVVKNA